MGKPKIRIFVKGGCVTEVTSNKKCKVKVIDEDCFEKEEDKRWTLLTKDKIKRCES